ncbi:MAG: MarR family transcriptional regulator with acetyltransferase activity [Bacteroidetes bacterium]|nr:MAG: MarR family transcriptional regulator with acetyltransferase activity [Bacteroidota bacterium]
MGELVKNLGYLAIASRMKMLSERLMKDVSRIYAEQGIPFEPRWFLVYQQLLLKSPMGITEIAGNIGLSYPAVNQIASEMERSGITGSRPDQEDGRKRLLYLTEDGSNLAEKLIPVWVDIELANRAMFRSASREFIETLDKIEQLLDQQGIYERVKDNIRLRIGASVTIVDYRPEFAPFFKSVNIDWLTTFFTVEPEDEAVLSDPENEILKKGGIILFALYNEVLIGTCAMISHGEGEWELAKMGVIEHYRRSGVGKKLIEAAIDRAKRNDATSLTLFTHEKLEAAVALYKRMGFRKAVKKNAAETQRFERGGFRMQLKLKK